MKDHNILAVYSLGSDSEDSYGDSSTIPIVQAEELVLDQDLADSVHWHDKARRLGERFSARTGGQPGDKGSLYRTPETSEPQISQQSAVSEGQLAQALPVIEPIREPKLQSDTPGQRVDLEWDDYVLGNEPFTPGLSSHHAEIARQLDRGQDNVAPYSSNFARQLLVESRLSSVPMTIPQIGTTYKQAKNMDSGANQKSNQVVTQPQPQLKP